MALPLFAATLFISAFILFLVQPMIGKLILPKLGGTPQVWNTCMVFFQTALLAGYAYTHTSSTKFPLRRQLGVHCLLLLLPFIVLVPPLGPFFFESWTPPLGSNPMLETLGALTLRVFLPFFVVATSAPLLQKWFVHTGHPAARDPYFLYGASNLGSLLALLAYPAIIEPYLGLKVQQPLTWTILYAMLVGLVMACAAMVWKSPPLVEMPTEPTLLDNPPPVQPQPATAVKPAPVTGISRKKFGKGKGMPTSTAAPSVARAQENLEIRADVMTNWRRLRWVLLAAAPSSLMLGVTTYICTDLSPIPLLWVVPLGLYLLTFILVFMRYPVVWIGKPHQFVLFLQPILVLALCMVLVRRGFSPVGPTIIALLGFFSTALVCHGELARDRPKPVHLTEFYLWMSVGGALGGMFNGLFAPLLFTGVVEFPLALVLGCLLRPQLKEEGWTDEYLVNTFPDMGQRLRGRGDELAKSYNRTPPHTTYLLSYALDIILPVLLGLLTLGLLYTVSQNWVLRTLTSLGFKKEARDWTPTAYYILVGFIPMVLCFLSYARPIRLGLGVGAILLAHMGFQAAHDDKVVYADRSYFGVLRVRETEDEVGYYTSLMHGTTHHGLNYQFPQKYRRMATTYYHQYGPAGMVMKKYNWFNDGYKWEDKEEGGPTGWLKDMLRFSSDARMPTSLIGLGTADLLTGSLPMTSMAGLWSEPPYATIGLGTGTMASYGRPFQHVHYYEIDNKIRRLNLPEDVEKSEKLWGEAAKAYEDYQKAAQTAKDNATKQEFIDRFKEAEETFRNARQAAESYHPFNYLMDAKKRGAEVQVRMGDARLRMAFNYKPYSEKEEVEGTAIGGGPDNFYHMMVVDAFSSDAIPIHLITKEAIQMYFKKLTPDGILCVHTSNRHVDLVPVVEATARSIKDYSPDGLVSLRAHDSANNLNIYGFPGHFTSEWVMVARSMDILKREVLKKEDLDLKKVPRGLATPKGYEEQAKQKYMAGSEQPERIEVRTDLWKYWIPPRDMPFFQPLPHPWTDDYSNVLSVFRW